MSPIARDIKPKWAYLFLGIILIVLTFVLDLSLPLGVADGSLYVGSILIGLLSRDRRLIWTFAILGGTLTIVGYFLSPPGGELWKVLVNRFISLLTIGMTTYLCLMKFRAGLELRKAHEKLEERVKERTRELDQANASLLKETDYLKLGKAIAVAANANRSLDETLQICLEHICKVAGWPVGHLYLTERNGSGRLIPSLIWYLEDPDAFRTFRQITEAFPLDPGVGLPGQVFLSGKPLWMVDVTRNPNFPRASLAKDIGVRAGFAFPVLIKNEVVGVMEFFSDKAAEPDEKMLEVMEQVGLQLGRAIERKFAEEDMENLLASLRERVKELTCMYGVASLIATSRNMQEVFSCLDSFIAPAWQFTDLARSRITFAGQTFCAPDFTETPWKQEAEITVRGKPQGVLEVFYIEEPSAREGCIFLKEEETLIACLADLLGVAASRKQAEEDLENSNEQLRKLYHQLENVREEERTRIARELHDELGQSLAVWKIDLSWMEKRIAPDQHSIREKIEAMYKNLDTTIREVNRISSELRPQILNVMGLCEALKWQTRKFNETTGMECQLELNGVSREFHPDLSTLFFRVYQETLTNVLRHAHATEVSASFEAGDQCAVLKVRDNGCGIEPNRVYNSRSFGLTGIRERAHLWGGEVKITGVPGEGTEVAIHIPLLLP